MRMTDHPDGEAAVRSASAASCASRRAATSTDLRGEHLERRRRPRRARARRRGRPRRLAPLPGRAGARVVGAALPHGRRGARLGQARLRVPRLGPRAPHRRRLARLAARRTTRSARCCGAGRARTRRPRASSGRCATSSRWCSTTSACRRDAPPRRVAAGSPSLAARARGAAGRAPRTARRVRAPGALREPRVLDRPPPGWARSAPGGRAAPPRRAGGRARGARAAHRRRATRAPTWASARRWQVSFYARTGREEIAQVVVDDRSGRVLETWTGFRVAWPMARGLPGQFGQAANAPWVWIALCALFVAPVPAPAVAAAARGPRGPARLLGLLRVLRRRERRGLRAHGPPAARCGCSAGCCGSAWRRPRAPVRLLLPAGALLWLLAFLVAFRVALNLVDGNVIDVGYAGVVGADRLLEGAPLWGAFPPDIPRGDTYGPALYLAYAPFELLWPWSGDLGRPAGRPRRGGRPSTSPACGGPVAGGAPARRPAARACCSPTCGRPTRSRCVVSNSGSSDALVGAARARRAAPARPARGARRGPRRGRPDQVRAAGARAAVRRLRPQPPRGRALTDARAAVAAAAVLLVPAATGPGGLALFWERTLGFQADRESPFSPWGLYGGLEWLQALVALAALALALVVALVPAPARRADGGRAGRGRARRGPARARPLVLPLPRVVPAARPDRARAGASPGGSGGGGRSSGSIAAARRRPAQRMSTALIHGSSSDGS